jgi:WD40 repeat protein
MSAPQPRVYASRAYVPPAEGVRGLHLRFAGDALIVLEVAYDERGSNERKSVFLRADLISGAIDRLYEGQEVSSWTVAGGQLIAPSPRDTVRVTLADGAVTVGRRTAEIVSPDGRYAACGPDRNGMWGPTCLVEMATGRELRITGERLDGCCYTGYVSWSPDSRYVYRQFIDDSIRSIDYLELAEPKSGVARLFVPGRRVQGASQVWFDDGWSTVLPVRNGTISLLAPSGGTRQAPIPYGRVTAASFTPRADAVTLGYENGSVVVAALRAEGEPTYFRLAEGETTNFPPRVATSFSVSSLAWSADGTELAAAYEDGDVAVWTRDSRHVAQWTFPGPVRELAWSTSGLLGAVDENRALILDPSRHRWAFFVPWISTDGSLSFMLMDSDDEAEADEAQVKLSTLTRVDAVLRGFAITTDGAPPR